MIHPQDDDSLLARQLRAHAASVTQAKRQHTKDVLGNILVAAACFVCGAIVGIWWAS